MARELTRSLWLAVGFIEVLFWAIGDVRLLRFRWLPVVVFWGRLEVVIYVATFD